MKKVLLAVVGILFASTSFAQNELVASLSHEGDVTYFYGMAALQNAVAAAESGDIINLSGGSFYATDITKAITLHGAGIDSEVPTYIAGDFYLDIPSTDANRFMMEGIRCPNKLRFKGEFNNPYFLRCQFNEVNRWDEGVHVTNITFANCKVTGYLRYSASNTYILVNCFVNDMYKEEWSSITASNCVFIRNDFSLFRDGTFFNCIFVSKEANHETYRLHGSAQATNCISVNFAEGFDIFRDCNVSKDCTKEPKSLSTVFKTYRGDYSDEETFELTDEGKAILGADGKQIGMYGGLLPYTSKPSYPLISKMTVPEKTDNLGKMDVTVTISSAE